MAKQRAIVNGKVTVVEIVPIRKGGTLQMPTLTIRSKRDKLRDRKPKHRPDWRV